ncbi:uncharacterized protein LOC134761654 isoform X4 [Pongo abelii]
MSLKSATKWGRRCNYYYQHLESVMNLLEYFLALTSFILLCSYWIFPSVNNMEVPIQGQIIPGFIWSYLKVKSLEFLTIPFLYGLQFDRWEFSTLKKTLLLSGNPCPPLTSAQNCFPHSLTARVVKNWDVLLRWAVECHVRSSMRETQSHGSLHSSDEGKLAAQLFYINLPISSAKLTWFFKKLIELP